ncbi:hypothetical protein LTR22_028421, partial [Elasticomyces elasticus]
PVRNILPPHDLRHRLEHLRRSCVACHPAQDHSGIATPIAPQNHADMRPGLGRFR